MSYFLSFKKVNPSDFYEGGPLGDIELPYSLPIPEKMLKHIYGDDYGIGFRRFSKAAEARYLEYLHEVLYSRIIRICNCGEHMCENIQCKPKSE